MTNSGALFRVSSGLVVSTPSRIKADDDFVDGVDDFEGVEGAEDCDDDASGKGEDGGDETEGVEGVDLDFVCSAAVVDAVVDVNLDVDVVILFFFGVVDAALCSLYAEKASRRSIEISSQRRCR